MANNWRRPGGKATGDRYRKKLKSEVIAAYGSECACCGEKDIRFLTIDHKDGGGTQHRLALCKGKKVGGVRFYQILRIEQFPDGYEVLCWNCNCGRQLNGGICPHKETR